MNRTARHDHDDLAVARAEGIPNVATALATAEAVAELQRRVDLAIELMCPKCAPAAIVRMHPDLGPQPMGPASLRSNAPEAANGADLS